MMYIQLITGVVLFIVGFASLLVSLVMTADNPIAYLYVIISLYLTYIGGKVAEAA